MAMDTDGYHFKVDLPTAPADMIIPVTKSCDARRARRAQGHEPSDPGSPAPESLYGGPETHLLWGGHHYRNKRQRTTMGW